MHGLEALDRDILLLSEPEPHDVQQVGGGPQLLLPRLLRCARRLGRPLAPRPCPRALLPLAAGGRCARWTRQQRVERRIKALASSSAEPAIEAKGVLSGVARAARRAARAVGADAFVSLDGRQSAGVSLEADDRFFASRVDLVPAELYVPPLAEEEDAWISRNERRRGAQRRTARDFLERVYGKRSRKQFKRGQGAEAADKDLRAEARRVEPLRPRRRGQEEPGRSEAPCARR
jgi:hypothetical protein